MDHPFVANTSHYPAHLLNIFGEAGLYLKSKNGCGKNAEQALTEFRVLLSNKSFEVQRTGWAQPIVAAAILQGGSWVGTQPTGQKVEPKDFGRYGSDTHKYDLQLQTSSDRAVHLADIVGQSAACSGFQRSMDETHRTGSDLSTAV